MHREEKIASSSNPWVEKYRPQSINDVAHQSEVVATLLQAVERGAGNLPHLLFYGPPGTGKTSLALALVKQLFPPDIIRQRVLELNASDERGIRVVREKIKVFAKGAVAQPKPGSASSVPPFKVIILDEADAVTSEAQTALRRTMETYSKVTRFILICNYISRIIAPLASRCAKFRFQSLPLQTSLSRLRHVCDVEKVTVGDEVLTTIVEQSRGDLRKAITTLQSASRMVRPGESITADMVETASCKVPAEAVKSFRDSIRASSNFEKVRGAVEQIIHGGYPADRLLYQLCDEITAESYDALDELQKSALMIKLARAERCLGDGASERLQLLDVGASGLQISKSRGEDLKAILLQL